MGLEPDYATEFAAAVSSADRPLTEGEIADRVGVSRPTVGNHRDALQSHPDVAFAKVGRATVYWPAGVFDRGDTAASEELPVDELEDDSAETFTVRLGIHERAAAVGGALIMVALAFIVVDNFPVVALLLNAPPLAVVLLAAGVVLFAAGTLADVLAKYRSQPDDAGGTTP